MVLVILNVPWAKAKVIAGVKSRLDCIHSIKLVNGKRRTINSTVSITFKRTWAAATHLAAIFEPIDANVPILAPMTIPIACRRFKSLADTSPTVITVTPELDWIKADIAKPTSIPRKGLLVYLSI